MFGPHVTDSRNYCRFCGKAIGPANAGTGCEKNEVVIDRPDAAERRRYAILQAACALRYTDKCDFNIIEDGDRWAIGRAQEILRLIENSEVDQSEVTNGNPKS